MFFPSLSVRRLMLLVAGTCFGLLNMPRTAEAVLGGFDTADGYSQLFVKDVWSYDAGVTGGPIAPNTGRWTELLGSGVVGDVQYFSQHGYGGGGAATPPFA